MKSLAILHLAANRWWTGSADPTIHLASALRARGHRVLLGVTPGDRFEAKAREAGLELVDGLALDTRGRPHAIVSDVRRLRRLVRDAAIDVIHAHHSHDHWLGWLASTARAPRVAVARTFHNRRAVRTSALARWLYARTDAFFAVTREIEADARAAGTTSERVSWLPGVADLVRFHASVDGSPVREEFKLGDAPVVVSVARFAARRGHERLLAGFRRLLRDVPSARLLLVGKGELRARLEQIVVESGLSERVVFTGYRDRDLPAVLAASDCFVLMAPGSDESGRAALEAMAASRPIVVGRRGALPEMVAQGETGIVLDDDAPETIASALRAVLIDRSRARLMGHAGRRRAEDVFAPARSVEIVERLYRTIA
jgi:L-malate glycosyltransferase